MIWTKKIFSPCEGFVTLRSMIFDNEDNMILAGFTASSLESGKLNAGKLDIFVIKLSSEAE